ncbi:glutamate-cysteine ligase-domain-containing protein [Dimargaris cristalligena]|uniref:Glutamate--cysteine ligase n=1 Tax=Dimargaris cristalligena TaxID=215637 RepID=A0A4P9ZTH4_9FUNG|nr:glutamate-cysteine ligase-domain-containing protein [Dimargaris cristalligena]|eukprot:RKP36777.1 glutamate-cysteine ligase-domain-containing protein [Dimargaris cristalligena]
MGWLGSGMPLDWDDSAPYRESVRQAGLNQFIRLVQKGRYRHGDLMKWGDEIEYTMVSLDSQRRTTRLSAQAGLMLNEFHKEEQVALEKGTPEELPALWRTEYGRYIIEGTPGQPYGPTLDHLLQVEASMQLRRRILKEKSRGCAIPLTITAFPRLGTLGFMDTRVVLPGLLTASQAIPDAAVSQNSRYQTLPHVMMGRRRNKFGMLVPIFPDSQALLDTPDPDHLADDLLLTRQPALLAHATPEGSAYFDATCYGFGACCLQVTMQAYDFNQARRLYDQLAPFCAIMLSLTAATPANKGRLLTTDTRWLYLSSGSDDRSEEEMAACNQSGQLMYRPRCDSIHAYVGSNDGFFRDSYNDVPYAHDPRLYDQLRAAGLDSRFAQHTAHVFTLDPLVVMREHLPAEDYAGLHCDTFTSTLWQAMKLKPPTLDGSAGWRVEFRPMEIQLSDFENAAFSIFIVLLARTILHFHLNFYIPVSHIDANMSEANNIDAAHRSQFYFRTNIFGNQANEASQGIPADPPISRLTVDEIMNGKENLFAGILPLIHAYLDQQEVDITTRLKINKYLGFIRKRASGALLTDAQWIREFVRSHPEYQHDSVVSHPINYDLMQAIEKIGQGISRPSNLL